MKNKFADAIDLDFIINEFLLFENVKSTILVIFLFLITFLYNYFI